MVLTAQERQTSSTVRYAIIFIFPVGVPTAIRFVVNDVFTPLRQEEREQLLHEGNGNVISTATVEVILDNSDRRFPVHPSP